MLNIWYFFLERYRFTYIVLAAIIIAALAGTLLAPVGASAVWFVYRIVKGWTELNEGRPMYA